VKSSEHLIRFADGLDADPGSMCQDRLALLLSVDSLVAPLALFDLSGRDVQEWLSTFPFLPISMFNSHSFPSRSQLIDSFPFPWDSGVCYSHSVPFSFPCSQCYCNNWKYRGLPNAQHAQTCTLHARESANSIQKTLASGK